VTTRLQTADGSSNSEAGGGAVEARVHAQESTADDSRQQQHKIGENARS
jgi:hypothetical protein